MGARDPNAETRAASQHLGAMGDARTRGGGCLMENPDSMLTGLLYALLKIH